MIDVSDMEIFRHWNGLSVQYAFIDARGACVSEINKEEALEPSYRFFTLVCLYPGGNLLSDRASKCKILEN